MPSRSLARVCLSSLVVLAAFFMLTACSTEQIRSPKPHSDWSRGLRIGQTAGLTSPSLFVEPDGTAHIAWTAETLPSEGSLGYGRISPSGELTAQAIIHVPEKHLRGGSLRSVEGNLEICWNSDEGVRCSPINQDAPEQLQPYTLITSPPMIITYDTEGEYYAWITVDDDLLIASPNAQISTLSSQAINLDLYYDKDTVFIAWSEAKTEGVTTFWLMKIDDQDMETPKQVGRVTAGVLSGMRQTNIGVITVDNEVCTFYDVEFTRGLEGSNAFTEFGCLDDQTWLPSNTGRLGLISTEPLDYVTYDGPFAIDRIAKISIPASDFTYNPSKPVSIEDNLAIAVSTPGQKRYRVRQQIALLILEDGQTLGYQPVSDTNGTSLSPALTSDMEGNLYTVWLERTTTSSVYFATTNPLASDTLNQVDFSEVTVTLLGVVVEAVTGLFMLPFALVWLGVGFVGVGVGVVITRVTRLERWQDPVCFTLGIIGLWFSKLLFVPQLLTYVPFNAYLPELSATLALLWRAVCLLSILLIGLSLSRYVIRRWELPSLATRFGLYGVIDITLTALLFGVLLQGAV